MEPLEDVRVRYFDQKKRRGRKDLVPSCDSHVAAQIATNPAVAGLVSVASDYVYDEKKHGPILASLLHGVKVGHGRFTQEEETLDVATDISTQSAIETEQSEDEWSEDEEEEEEEEAAPRDD